jgi:hypothetical protein
VTSAKAIASRGRKEHCSACPASEDYAVHHPTTTQLIAVNKRVFCEKPLAENFPLADEMAREADTAGLVAMVNLVFRNVPQIQKARALVCEPITRDRLTRTQQTAQHIAYAQGNR